MSFPDLTPTSTQSAIVLPISASSDSISDAELTSSLAIGYYTGNAL